MKALVRHGVPSPRDRFTTNQGNAETGGYGWHVSPLRRLLQSQHLRGYAVTKGEVVLDSSGAPLVRAEPILDDVQWSRLQAHLASTSRAPSASKKPQALLTGVIFCGVCGSPAWVLRGGKGRKDRYRCKTANSAAPCGNNSVVMDDADEWYLARMEQFLDSPRVDRILVPGTRHAEEIAEHEERLTTLVDTLSRFSVGSAAHTAVATQIEAISGQIERLSKEGDTPDSWRSVLAGGTNRDHWESLDAEARNFWLKSAWPRMIFVSERGEPATYVRLLFPSISPPTHRIDSP